MKTKRLSSSDCYPTFIVLTKAGMSPVRKRPIQTDRGIYQMLVEIEKVKPDWQATIMKSSEDGDIEVTGSREWIFGYCNRSESHNA